MAYSYQSEVSDGTLQRVILSIPFYNKEDIHVYVEGQELSEADGEYSWEGDVAVYLRDVVPAGWACTLKRTTDVSKLRLKFSEGVAFTRNNLDDQNSQFLHIGQESKESALSDIYGDVDMHRFRIRNAGDPVQDFDYTTKGWVNRTYEGAVRDCAASALEASNAAAGATSAAGSALDSARRAEAAAGVVGPQVKEALRRSYAEIGLNLINGSFEEGATITDSQGVLLQGSTGKCFNWQGPLPSGGKIIPADSTPESTGGIGADKWQDVSDTTRYSQAQYSNGVEYKPYYAWKGNVVLQRKDEAVQFKRAGMYYRWDGAFPQGGLVIPKNTPEPLANQTGAGKYIAVLDLEALLIRTELADTTKGDALIGVRSVRAGAVARTQHDKNSDVLSGTDFGMSVSSVSATDAALEKTTALGLTYALPDGVFTTTKSASTIKGVFTGPGVIKGSDGNKRGKYFSNVTTPPKSRGNESSIVTAFNGDNSLSPFQVEHRISGANTLGKPATGYLYQPETIPNYTYLLNSSGWNQSLSGNGGRTGVAAYRAKVDQYGQGDAIAFNASVFVSGTKAGATNFLANPAGVLFNGDMTAGADGIYLNPHEVILHDNGFDVAAVGFVANMDRTVGTGAKTVIWHGARYQSVGSKSCDAIISTSGKWKNGIDFAQTLTDFGKNKAAISLKAGQRIYLNNAAEASGNTEAGWHTTVYNGDYIEYDTDHINVVAGGAPNLQVSRSQVTALKRIKAFETLDFVSAGNTSATAGAIASYLHVYVDGTLRKIALLNP